MAIRCTTTAYGPAALDALAQHIATHKRGDPLRPVTVIVPSNYVGVATRRALGRNGLAATSFLTVYRLAELLGAGRVAASGRRPVSTPVLAGAVRSVLRDDPGRFGGVETHPATERALVRAHRELSEVDDAALDRLAGQSGRAADVVRIHREVADRLRPHFSNEQDLVRAAVEAIRASTPAVDALGRVVVHLPQRLTTGQIALLRAVHDAVGVDLVAAVSGAPAADAPVLDAIDALGAEPTAGGVVSARPPDRALSLSDADDEVRHAVREVIDAVRGGAHLGRCAILYGSADPYARLVADALDGAAIAWCGAAVSTADTSLLGRSLLSMLALPDHHLSRRDVTAWLSSAPIRGADNRLAPTSAWERISRRAGILAGAGQWRDRLDRLVEDLEREADELARDEDQSWRADRNRREAERARELAEFVDRLDSDLDPGPRGRSWSGLAGWCRGLIRTYVGGEAMRARWPDDERRWADRIESVIDRLGDLDHVDRDPSLTSFRRALGLELENDLGRHGRFGSGVMVGPVSIGVGLELDRVVLLGLAEGSFPARRRDDALIPDRERRVVGPDLPLRAARADDDHRSLLAVLAAADEAVMLFPRGDLRRGAERAPSRWLLDAAEQHDGLRPTTDTLDHDTGAWFREVASFVAGLRQATFPAHGQEYDVRALLARHDSGVDPTTDPIVSERTEVARAMELTAARRSSRPTRFDGNLATDGDLRGAILPSPTDPDAVASATRLETWAGCPHAYFVRYVLGVEPVDAPELEYRVTPLVRGDLVHGALDRWLSEALEAGTVPDPGESWPEPWRERLIEIGTDECDRVHRRGQAGRPLYWARDRARILADIERILTFDDQQRRMSLSTPIATELDFGMPGSEHDPVVVALPDGRSMRVRGSIDRVDRRADGRLMVIDYKTGRSDDYRSLSPDDPAPGGGHLQLVLYAAAARALLGPVDGSAHGAYWFVSEVGGFETLGYEITPAVDRIVRTLMSEMSDGIRRGLYPLRPSEPRWRMRVPCWFCEPDGLGTREQWRDWERKRVHPDLEPYVAIAEPDLLHHVGRGDG